MHSILIINLHTSISQIYNAIIAEELAWAGHHWLQYFVRRIIYSLFLCGLSSRIYRLWYFNDIISERDWAGNSVILSLPKSTAEITFLLADSGSAAAWGREQPSRVKYATERRITKLYSMPCTSTVMGQKQCAANEASWLTRLLVDSVSATCTV